MERLSVKNLNRDWLRVTGPDSLRFLQGMLTCDLKRSVQATADSTIACGFGWLLTNKGKPIGEIVFATQSAESFWLSVTAGYGEKVRAALDHYLVADEVELVLVESPFAGGVYAVPNALTPVAPQAIAASVPDAKDRVYRVKVHPWGWELPRGSLGPNHVEFWVNDALNLPPLNKMSDEEFRRIRIEAGVPEWGTDYGEEDLILEFPTAAGISFFKGCYIGQEVVARATYRGKMNKSFARFKASDALATGYVYSEKDPEKPIGKLTSVSGSSALGLVRLAALDTEQGGGKLFQKNDAGPVSINGVDVLT